jgi:hypothetical protein
LISSGEFEIRASSPPIVQAVSFLLNNFFLFFLILAIFAVLDRYMLIQVVEWRNKLVIFVGMVTATLFIFCIAKIIVQRFFLVSERLFRILDIASVSTLTLWAAGIELYLSGSMIVAILPPSLVRDKRFRRLWICFGALIGFDVFVFGLQAGNHLFKFFNVALVQALTFSLGSSLHVMIVCQLLDWLKEGLSCSRVKEESSFGSLPNSSIFGAVGQSVTVEQSVVSK